MMFLEISQAYNFFKKETLAQVFSCEFCEISKNTFSNRTPPWLVLSNGSSEMFFKIDVLKNLAIFTGENLCWKLFLVKLQTKDLKACNFIK